MYTAIKALCMHVYSEGFGGGALNIQIAYKTNHFNYT